MSDETMTSEYADVDQRFAICNVAWEEKEMPGKAAKRLKRTFGKAMTADRDSYTLTAVISTRSKDRDGDIVEPRGAQLKNYTQNPIVLWAHDRKAPPIAKAEELFLGDDGIIAQVRFDKDDPFARLIFNKYAEGFLTSWSIGFSPADDGFEPLTDEKGVVTGYHFKEWELTEFSAVPVPANAEAITRALDDIENPEHKVRFAKAMADACKDDDKVLNMVKDLLVSEEPEEDPNLEPTSTLPIPEPSEQVIKTFALFNDQNPTGAIYEQTDEEDPKLIDKKLGRGALKKTIEERGKQGKIPVALGVALGEKSETRLDFDIIKEDEEEVKEVRLKSVELSLPLTQTTTESSTPPEESDRQEDKGEEQAESGEAPDITLDEIDAAIAVLNARAAML
jgi:HK97 family phage prohead protease